MKTKNIKEFKELILRYESITLKEIKRSGSSAHALTGFGMKDTCTLCLATKSEIFPAQCDICLWYRISSVVYPCNSGKNESTYYAIDTASLRNPQELLDAYRARAAYMRTVLKKLRIKQP
jgi:hypothetical protein